MARAYLAPEKRPLVRAWIWFWYSDATRICMMLGLPIPLVLLGAYSLFGPGEYLRNVAIFSYLLGLGWAMLDNDYTQLQRIGRDTSRKPLSERALALQREQHAG